MTTAIDTLEGVYELDRHHSSVQFAIKHVQVSTFRASFDDIDARLTVSDGTVSLEGRALVESVSISDPPEFRDHVVRGADFFAAAEHPELTFRSSSVELDEQGSATITGDLTIRGTTRTLTASGSYEPPREDPFGTWRAGLQLQATIDRRDWGLAWQLPLPDGSDALGWDVELTVQLELTRTS